MKSSIQVVAHSMHNLMSSPKLKQIQRMHEAKDIPITKYACSFIPKKHNYQKRLSQRHIIPIKTPLYYKGKIFQILQCRNSHQHQIYVEMGFENQQLDHLVKQFLVQESFHCDCVHQDFHP